MLGVVAFAFYVGVLLLIFREGIDDALFSGLFYALIFVVGAYFTQKRFRRTAARLDEHGQSLMFLRYPNSLPGSLSGGWQMGIPTPAPGRVDFQPAVDDELIPCGRSRALTGPRIAELPPRIASRNDNKQAVPFGFQIITLDSDGGVIEIAASPATLQKIQDTVEPVSS
ncbi:MULTISPECIES: hypothetical protein [unclassified Arthrobacter]|uniref:hypothetical protein n=1 Tax=unclassified Arthrobacter TaxID=235627 RepID=UPI0006FE95CD|nr:hypothetical protein [Arthrobacter sp. Soil764]KRE82672.1 hypothetical protein ASG86_10120 [Arthrobacter sp. Soil764]